MSNFIGESLCSHCDPQIIAQCPQCYRGYIWVPADGGNCVVCKTPLVPLSEEDKCIECHGRAEVPHPVFRKKWTKCAKCSGTGRRSTKAERT
jgi:hypothetical protein